MLPKAGYPKPRTKKRKQDTPSYKPPEGILELDPVGGLAPILTQDAINLGLKNPKVYVADDRMYVLFLDGRYEYSSPQAEGIACHVAMLALQRLSVQER